MGDRGRLSGIACHIEYHTTDRKKPKAANCIYLDTNRICHCKKSPWYLAKCFEATTCTYREREQKPVTTGNVSSDHHNGYNSIKTSASISKRTRTAGSLPIGSSVKHKVYGSGRLCCYDKDPSIMIIQFADKQARFKYPDAFEKGFLSLK